MGVESIPDRDKGAAELLVGGIGAGMAGFGEALRGFFQSAVDDKR